MQFEVGGVRVNGDKVMCYKWLKGRQYDQIGYRFGWSY